MALAGALGLLAAAPAFALPAAPTLYVKSSNGYALKVLASVRTRDVVIGSVRHDRGTLIGADYGVKGTVTAKRIKASFGELGKIDVKLVAGDRQRLRPARRCDGVRRPLRRIPVWTGVVRFAGEGAYTRVRSSSAPAKPFDHPALNCVPSLRSELLNPSMSFSASDDDFYAYGWPRPTRWDLTAGREAAGRVGILRYAKGTLPDAAWSIGEGLATATLTPGIWPFSGSGTYVAGNETGVSGRGTFVGDLTIDLPGRDDFPLGQAGSPRPCA